MNYDDKSDLEEIHCEMENVFISMVERYDPKLLSLTMLFQGAFSYSVLTGLDKELLWAILFKGIEKAVDKAEVFTKNNKIDD